MSEIDNKYTQLGGNNSFLANSTTEERVCPDGIGHYRHYQHGSIYWHPRTGAKEIHGLIRKKWAKLGWEKSVLGYPKTDESNSPVGKGKYNLFQGGTILWFPPQKEAFEVHGSIRSKWAGFGFESGFLGFPITDEKKCPDTIGRYNHFQKGSIYWKPSISAHEVHGLIRKYWAAHGWERNSSLGYPISDELPTKQGSKNRYNDFENGILFWKKGNASATALSKLTLYNASKTATEIMVEIKKLITPIITKSDDIYIKSGPKISKITDYSFDGNRIHNRNYKINVSMGVDVPVLSDPTIKLDLWIEISLDKQAKKIFAYLTKYHYHVHVPRDTHFVGVDASDIGNEIKKNLDPYVWKAFDVFDLGSIPEQINILSVKVMPNGDLNIYIEPLI